MQDTRFNLNVLGVDVTFRSQIDPERIQLAKAFVEEHFEKLKLRGGQFSREQLLILLVMGIAGDLLQSQEQLDELYERLEVLLSRIEHRTKCCP